MEGEGVVYEGRRFRVACSLDGKPYGAPFGLDVGIADRLLTPTLSRAVTC